jgi:hypothetical protein
MRSGRACSPCRPANRSADDSRIENHRPVGACRAAGPAFPRQEHVRDPSGTGRIAVAWVRASEGRVVLSGERMGIATSLQYTLADQSFGWPQPRKKIGPVQSHAKGTLLGCVDDGPAFSRFSLSRVALFGPDSQRALLWHITYSPIHRADLALMRSTAIKRRRDGVDACARLQSSGPCDTRIFRSWQHR